MRDDKWLFSKLDEVWDTYFSDVPQDNDVHIVWGRKARNRLGSIKEVKGERLKVKGSNKYISHLLPQTPNLEKHPSTVITINSLFKDEEIPEFVILGTIAHELAHYTHGFHSPLEQRFPTPHAGGVVHKEMRDRGLEQIHKKQKKWLKDNWRNYVMENYPPSTRKRRRVVLKWI